MATEVIARIKTVSVTKALAAATAYDANDVISQSATAGTTWNWADIVRSNGAGGYIVGAIAQSESESVTPRLTVYLYTATPTGALNDHAANTNPDAADKAGYIGKIDFEALESLGTTDSCAGPNSSFKPLPFVCATADRDLYGVCVTRDAFTQTAGDDLTITLFVEQAM